MSLVKYKFVFSSQFRKEQFVDLHKWYRVTAVDGAVYELTSGSKDGWRGVTIQNKAKKKYVTARILGSAGYDFYQGKHFLARPDKIVNGYFLVMEIRGQNMEYVYSPMITSVEEMKR